MPTLCRACPTGNDIVPRLLDRVLRIHDVVPVDHFLPGLPAVGGHDLRICDGSARGPHAAVEGRKFGS